MKLHLRMYFETVRYFESKERHCEVCVIRPGVKHLQSCSTKTIKEGKDASCTVALLSFILVGTLVFKYRVNICA
jgi:hypothetical protein